MAESNFWGGVNTSKDYLMLLEGRTPASKPDSLIGHTLTNFNIDQIDRVTAIVVRLERNRIVEKQIVLRPARQTGVTGTIGFGSEGPIYTPLLQRVRRGNCELNLYIKRLCVADDQTAHFYALIGAVFNPPTFVNDLISIDDTNPVTQQSEFRASDMILSFVVGAFRVADLVPPLYAVSFMTAECEDCDSGEFEQFVVGGGDGSGDSYLAKTADRFGTMVALTPGTPADDVITGLYTDGNVIMASFADDPDATVATTGGVAFSSDAGSSFALDTNITASINDVEFFMGQYIAVGGVGGGQGLLYTSDDGINWTSVTSVALSATKALTSIAVDKANECFYACGETGLFVKGTKSGTTINLTAITPSGAGTNDLFRVAVYGDSHIAVGGAAKYYAESTDGGETWLSPSLPGSGTVRGIAGMKSVRAVVAVGTGIADRTIMTDNQFSLKTVQSGISITGDYRDVAGFEGEHEYFIAVTDDGEVVLLRPFSPGS